MPCCRDRRTTQRQEWGSVRRGQPPPSGHQIRRSIEAFCRLLIEASLDKSDHYRLADCPRHQLCRCNGLATAFIAAAAQW